MVIVFGGDRCTVDMDLQGMESVVGLEEMSS